MITILIENLKFKCIIGLLEFERVKEQEICVDAKFKASEFVDYALVCEIFENDFKKQKFLKVEDALCFFESKFKEKYKSLSYFYMKIIKTKIIVNASVGAIIEQEYKSKN